MKILRTIAISLSLMLTAISVSAASANIQPATARVVQHSEKSSLRTPSLKKLIDVPKLPAITTEKSLKAWIGYWTWNPTTKQWVWTWIWVSSTGAWIVS